MGGMIPRFLISLMLDKNRWTQLTVAKATCSAGSNPPDIKAPKRCLWHAWAPKQPKSARMGAWVCYRVEMGGFEPPCKKVSSKNLQV